ncbi:unnamed protein product, partial [Rotaria magnacalcarata]
VDGINDGMDDEWNDRLNDELNDGLIDLLGTPPSCDPVIENFGALCNFDNHEVSHS